MARQGVGRAHPDRFELLGLIGHRRLPFGHACYQERHVKAPWQVAVGDPVRQHKHLVGGQGQAVRLALVHKGGLAVQRRNVAGVGPAAVGMAGQQQAQLFKTLADGSNRLGQVQLALRGTARGRGVRCCIRRIDAATGEHIGARREAGGERAARHQSPTAHREAETAKAHRG